MSPKHILNKALRLPCQGALVALLGMAFIATAIAAPSDLPALVQPANSEHHVGKVIWADLITTDVEGAKRFYGGLLGWTFRDITTGQNNSYTVALLDDQPVAGLISHDVPAGEHRQPAWLPFMAVRDVNAAKRIALAHGAKLLVEPRTYPQRGQQAVFADPQGAVFAVLASRSGDPADDEVSSGEWIWSSLMTRDADTDAAFYQSIFGYEVFDLASDGGNHLVLSSDNFARASVNTMSGTNANRHPHWLNFVRVANVVEASAKATGLGGRVLVEPHVDRHGGRVAVLADPAGAPFGLMEWSDNDSMESAK
jgi:predicted enzyme related to lactoylglutathione lyase